MSMSATIYSQFGRVAASNKIASKRERERERGGINFNGVSSKIRIRKKQERGRRLKSKKIKESKKEELQILEEDVRTRLK